MRRPVISMCLTALCALALVSCNNGPDEKGEYYQVNKHMAGIMYRNYLWNDHINGSTTIPSTDPQAFFQNHLLYSGDKWSVLVDEASELISSVTNDGKAFGWGIQGFWNPHGTEIWAAVLYVHKDTPAEKAGFERGDVIKRISGKPMTEDRSLHDWRNLMGSGSITVTCTKADGSEVTKSLSAQEGYLDPVICHTIFSNGSSKVGYLFYSDFVTRSESDLRRVFAGFKASGVNDLIVDLRYNGGGTSATARLLASLIVPENYLDGGSVFTQMIFNDDTEKEYLSKDERGNTLGLRRVYFLTGPGTASASEQTIIGLMPYMQVYTVGVPTHGKFVGGTIYPYATKTVGGVSSLVPDRSTPMKDWCMYMMMFRYSNRDGYPQDSSGLPPTVTAGEKWNSLPPVGDPSDICIANALNHIDTGQWISKEPTRSSEVKGIGLPMTPGVPRGLLVTDPVNRGVSQMP